MSLKHIFFINSSLQLTLTKAIINLTGLVPEQCLLLNCSLELADFSLPQGFHFLDWRKQYQTLMSFSYQGANDKNAGAYYATVVAYWQELSRLAGGYFSGHYLEHLVHVQKLPRTLLQARFLGQVEVVKAENNKSETTVHEQQDQQGQQGQQTQANFSLYGKDYNLSPELLQVVNDYLASQEDFSSAPGVAKVAQTLFANLAKTKLALKAVEPGVEPAAELAALDQAADPAARKQTAAKGQPTLLVDDTAFVTDAANQGLALEALHDYARSLAALKSWQERQFKASLEQEPTSQQEQQELQTTRAQENPQDQQDPLAQNQQEDQQSQANPEGQAAVYAKFVERNLIDLQNPTGLEEVKTLGNLKHRIAGIDPELTSEYELYHQFVHAETVDFNFNQLDQVELEAGKPVARLPSGHQVSVQGTTPVNYRPLQTIECVNTGLPFVQVGQVSENLPRLLTSKEDVVDAILGANDISQLFVPTVNLMIYVPGASFQPFFLAAHHPECVSVSIVESGFLDHGQSIMFNQTHGNRYDDFANQGGEWTSWLADLQGTTEVLIGQEAANLQAGDVQTRDAQTRDVQTVGGQVTAAQASKLAQLYPATDEDFVNLARRQEAKLLVLGQEHKLAHSEAEVFSDFSSSASSASSASSSSSSSASSASSASAQEPATYYGLEYPQPLELTKLLRTSGTNPAWYRQILSGIEHPRLNYHNYGNSAYPHRHDFSMRFPGRFWRLTSPAFPIVENAKVNTARILDFYEEDLIKVSESKLVPCWCRSFCAYEQRPYRGVHERHQLHVLEATEEVDQHFNLEQLKQAYTRLLEALKDGGVNYLVVNTRWDQLRQHLNATLDLLEIRYTNVTTDIASEAALFPRWHLVVHGLWSWTLLTAAQAEQVVYCHSQVAYDLNAGMLDLLQINLPNLLTKVKQKRQQYYQDVVYEGAFMEQLDEQRFRWLQKQLQEYAEKVRSDLTATVGAFSGNLRSWLSDVDKVDIYFQGHYRRYWEHQKHVYIVRDEESLYLALVGARHLGYDAESVTFLTDNPEVFHSRENLKNLKFVDFSEVEQDYAQLNETFNLTEVLQVAAGFNVKLNNLLGNCKFDLYVDGFNSNLAFGLMGNCNCSQVHLLGRVRTSADALDFGQGHMHVFWQDIAEKYPLRVNENHPLNNFPVAYDNFINLERDQEYAEIGRRNLTYRIGLPESVKLTIPAYAQKLKQMDEAKAAEQAAEQVADAAQAAEAASGEAQA